VRINNIVIKNFRVLADIQCDLGPSINVIVGPNAIGKTTVLQAIRLAKALLAPRSPNEAQQTLISLGAASQHFPQRLFLGALARDMTRPIEIRSTFSLLDEEINAAWDQAPVIIRGLLQSQLGQAFGNPTALIQYLGSPQGQAAAEQTEKQVMPFLEKLRSDKLLTLSLNIDPTSGQISTGHAIAGPILGYLDQSLPPHVSIFSYLPADRALPFGETPVQLGAADTQQQLRAHNSQPQLKYSV
jgi:AAA ATPase domain